MRSGRAATPLLNGPSIARDEGKSRWGGVRSGVKTRGNHTEETTCQGEDALAGATQMSRVVCCIGSAAHAREATAPLSIVLLRRSVVRETH